MEMPIGHFRLTQKIRFSCKQSSLFIYSNSKGLNVSADIKFDLILDIFFCNFEPEKGTKKSRYLRRVSKFSRKIGTYHA